MKPLKERIEIEQAYDNGKKLDFRMLSAKIETWYELPENEDDIVFQWDMNDYRIKPEPMEFWVNCFDGEFELFASSHGADEHSKWVDMKVKTIKVREVIE